MTDIIIGDIHLDMKSGDKNFMAYQHLFFEQILKYTTNNNIRYMIFLGDIFTNKQNINIEIMDYTLEIFDKMAKLVDEIILINGNHVIYHKNSYDIDSVTTVFKNRSNLENVSVFKEYLIKDDYLFVNWKNTREEYIELFNKIPNKNKIKYIFGHFELFGFMQSRFSENSKLNSTKKEDIFNQFPNLKKIISGHYHTPQHLDNVFYPGVPYQLAWSDYGMELGFYTLDKSKFKFHENKYEIFEHINIESESDITDYVIPDIPYNKYYKITYNNPKFDDMVQEFKTALDKKGHKTTLISTFDVFSDEETSDIPDNIELSESKSKQNSVEMNIEGIFMDYIYSIELAKEDLDILYDRFNLLYKETKMEVAQSLEI